MAVYLVVAFHAGADSFSGGFIGVDVFFVLSGYLVTQLLVRDISSGGSVRFLRFYARRMRRLAPAAAVVLIVTAIVYSAIASPAELASAVGSFKAAFLYVANWYFINESADYFATNINTNPVIHFWSLAIEEQFYLVWPMLLGGLYAATRRLNDKAHRARQVVVVAAGLASALWALSLSSEHLNRAYYGTDARAYQLLAGAFLALSPGLIRRAARSNIVSVMAALLALLALLVLSSSLIDISVSRRGIGATIFTATLIVAIESARGGPVNRLLSCGPAVYLGKISYGTYLWHWPVILVALYLTDDTISPISLFCVAALVATGVASLSYSLLERPIREQRLLDRLNPVVIVAGLSVSIVSAFVIIPYILDPQRSVATTVETIQPGSGSAGGSISAAELDAAAKDFYNITHNGPPNVGRSLKGVKFLPGWNCEGQPGNTCTIVHGSGKHILVFGDSHAWAMFPTFAKIAQDNDLSLSTAAEGGCPWPRNYFDTVVSADVPNRIAQCLEFKNDLYDRVIPELKPDLIVVIMSDEYLDHGAVHDANGNPIAVNSDEEERSLIEAESRRSVEELEKHADKVLIVDPVPITDYAHDPFQCLTKTKALDPCRFVGRTQPTMIDDAFADLADGRKTYQADFDELVCPFMPICDPVVQGQIVRFDRQHITPRFAVSLAPSVAAFMKQQQLIN